MTRRTRLRRTGILCLHCLRNVAFYRVVHGARNEWSLPSAIGIPRKPQEQPK
jgi:hypothetical protein